MSSRGAAGSSSLVVLEGDRVIARELPPTAAPRVAAYHRDNLARLAPWSPPRPAGFTTDAHWRERLRAERRESRAGRALGLHLVLRDDPDGPVIGEIRLSQIARGPFQNAFLGYSIGHRHEGRGLMGEALGLVAAHALGPMQLHRIQANHLPSNERSARLLLRAGFVVEGLAREYLFIDGAWRDHVMTALVHPGHPGPG